MKNLSKETDSLKAQESVVNLFFLGTGQHRDQFANGDYRSNLVYELYSMCEDNSGEKAVDHKNPQFNHLFDGAGGKPETLESKKANPMPGQYIYVPSETVPGEGTKRIGKQHATKVAQLLGNALGFGVEDNVHEAMAYIEQLVALGYPPKTVNLTGFSRGSYTAIIVANMLYHMYPEVEVNLCLFDPVAGPTLKGNPMATVIPPNVKHALIFYQKHEEGLVFEAQSKNRIRIADPTKTIVEYETVAGGHNESTRYHRDETNHSHRLASGLTYQKFKEFGIRFKKDAVPMKLKNYRKGTKRWCERVPLDSKDMTDEGRLLLYMAMKQNEKEYAAEAKNKLFKRDHITKALEEYVRDPQFFYNQRHREIFKKLLPKIFSYRFEMNAGGYTKEQIQQELKDFATNKPELYAAITADLKEMGFVQTANGEFNIPKNPQGIYLVEESPTLNNQVVVKENDELAYLLWAITTATNYAKIKTSTIHQAKIDDIANQLQIEINLVLKEEPSREKQITKIEDAIRKATTRLQLDVGSCKLLSQLNAILNDPVSYANEAHNLINKRAKSGTAAGEAIAKQIQKDIARIVDNKKSTSTEKTQAIDAKLHLLQNSAEQQGNKVFAEEIKQLRSFRKTQPQLIDRMVNRIDSFLFKNSIKRILTEIKSFFVKVSPSEKEEFKIKEDILEGLKAKLLTMQATGETVTKEKLSIELQESLKDTKRLEHSDDIRTVLMKCFDEITPMRSRKAEKIEESKKEIEEPHAEQKIELAH